jgi:quercetin dioxygenase-like cupin family protein
MSSTQGSHDENHLETAALYVLQALPSDQMSVFEDHLFACSECRDEIRTLQQVLNCFASWPTDVLRPSTALWDRLSQRISEESRVDPVSIPSRRLPTAEWEQVAEGISCKVLAVDDKTGRITMLVRLAPGTDYPPHRHADSEELHLLHGELMINDQKVHAGEFVRAEAGSVDHRVCSQTGCTCVLITSTKDTIF